MIMNMFFLIIAVGSIIKNSQKYIKKDEKVKIIALSKNFGTAKSTLNGILRCQEML